MLAQILSLPWLQIVSALLLISEGLALVPGIPANGILDGIIRVLKAAKEKLTK
jgi:hypothetical protein